MSIWFWPDFSIWSLPLTHLLSSGRQGLINSVIEQCCKLCALLRESVEGVGEGCEGGVLRAEGGVEGG